MQFIQHTIEDQLKNPNGSSYRHYILLNEKEVDKFTPKDGTFFYYRKNDKWESGYSRRSSLAILRKEHYDWFQETFGPEYSEYWNKIDKIYYNSDLKIKIARYSEDWRKVYGFITDDKKKWRLALEKNRIYFKNIDDVMLFKLTWC